MISELHIRRFKSIQQASIRLGSLTVFIGPNAGGKSNILDAIRVLQGIGSGYTIREVFDGRREDATRQRWEGIRGGSQYVLTANGAAAPQAGSALPTAQPNLIYLQAKVGELDGKMLFRYTIKLDPTAGTVRHEVLHNLINNYVIYDTHPEGPPLAEDPQGPVITARVRKGRGGGAGRAPHYDFSVSQSILTQLKGSRAGKEENEEYARESARALADVQFLDVSPTILREYSMPGATRMGDRGENFASVVHAICSNEATKRSYLSWLQELTPMKVEDVHLFKTELNELRFGLKEQGIAKPIPALSLSDGTLRFAAIAASLFQPQPPGLLLIEEIENGVHATRLRLLVEMLRQRSAKGSPQVIATTHSPLLLAYLPEEFYQYVFWVSRDTQTGQTHISSLPQIPHFNEVIRKQPINNLFADGWLEAAV